MKARGFILVSLIAIGGCGNLRVPPVPAHVAPKRAEVESLVKRHGYTCAGHPAGEPVMLIGILDENFDCDTLLELRRCSLASSAYSYKIRDDGAITFVFKEDREPYKAHLAGISSDGGFWVNHSYTALDVPGFTRLPPNISLERTREK